MSLNTFRDEDGNLLAEMNSVVVPVGCRAVFVSDQLLDYFKDWTLLEAPAPFIGIEVRAIVSGDTAEVESRYVTETELK